MVCTKCGCKFVVACTACAVVGATFHHGSLCGQFNQDRGGVYCAQPIAEPAHGPHNEQPPITWVRSIPTLMSTTSISSTIISGSGPIIWRT